LVAFGVLLLLLFVFMGRAIENFAVYHKNNKICIIIIYIFGFCLRNEPYAALSWTLYPFRP